jgi:hypothetical protein
VIILGADKVGANLVRALQRDWSWDSRRRLHDRLAPVGRVLEGVPYGGALTDMMSLPRKQREDTVNIRDVYLSRQSTATVYRT